MLKGGADRKCEVYNTCAAGHGCGEDEEGRIGYLGPRRDLELKGEKERRLGGGLRKRDCEVVVGESYCI